MNGSAPTGNVGFTADGATISGCSAAPFSGGTTNAPTATCSSSSLNGARTALSPRIRVNATNSGSTSATLSQVVNKPPSTTLLSTSATPSLVGVSVTFSATVSGTAPTGNVGFTADGTTLSGCGTVALPTGSANSKIVTCNTASLAVGTHSIVATYAGDAGNNGSTSATLSQVVNAGGGGTDVVWVEDAVPAGATVASDGGDGWNWISSNPTPYSGSLAHQSALAAGEHQHYFYYATSTLTVGVGDTLFAYVYLDPANPPSEVMLQWWDGSSDDWHRAYWGANLLGWGTDGTVYRHCDGRAAGDGAVGAAVGAGGADRFGGEDAERHGLQPLWRARHLGPCREE